MNGDSHSGIMADLSPVVMEMVVRLEAFRRSTWISSPTVSLLSWMSMAKSCNALRSSTRQSTNSFAEGTLSHWRLRQLGRE